MGGIGFYLGAEGLREKKVGGDQNLDVTLSAREKN
jgi:hypothetical protein